MWGFNDIRVNSETVTRKYRCWTRPLADATWWIARAELHFRQIHSTQVLSSQSMIFVPRYGLHSQFLSCWRAPSLRSATTLALGQYFTSRWSNIVRIFRRNFPLYNLPVFCFLIIATFATRRHCWSTMKRGLPSLKRGSWASNRMPLGTTVCSLEIFRSINNIHFEIRSPSRIRKGNWLRVVFVFMVTCCSLPR